MCTTPSNPVVASADPHLALSLAFALCGLFAAGSALALSSDRDKDLEVHPRFEALFPLVSWFGLRMEAGYNYGFSPNRGWREEEYNGDYRHITNSPETKFGAFTISAGPWFGF